MQHTFLLFLLSFSDCLDGVDIYTSDNILEHPDFFEVHKFFTMRDLFNAKVHLGHHEGCWNPLMKPYLFGTREHQHIIDLDETVKHLRVGKNVKQQLHQGCVFESILLLLPLLKSTNESQQSLPISEDRH